MHVVFHSSSMELEPILTVSGVLLCLPASKDFACSNSYLGILSAAVAQRILSPFNQWRICRMRVRVIQAKPWNCFRRLEKLVLPSILDTSLSSLMMWNLHSLRNNIFEWKNVTFLGQNILWPLLHLFRGQDPQLPPPRSTPLLSIDVFIKM